MIRAFIAIQFPAGIKQNINQAVSPLRARVGELTVRWVDPALYHLTLKFLGEIDESRLDAIADIVEWVASTEPTFALEVGEFGVFPDARRPRVLWVGLNETTGTLQSLKGALDQSLKSEGFRVEKRPFHPHVTVGRVRRGSSTGERETLAAELDGYSVGRLGIVPVDSIQLLRSRLNADGPIYSELVSFPLGGGRL
ncbi:MAG: RNA 2',3'-cyclic phosphodiesterase [Anaerolineales bacterium]|nr:RNA 2',3'-cyclic phosphodiesterase [Anaerolineales bacterium]